MSLRLSFGRIATTLLVLALTVSCGEPAAEDTCGGGCAFGGGSPHPYTTTTGGRTSVLTGEVRLEYGGEPTSLACGSSTYASPSSSCSWEGAAVTIDAPVPNGWFVADAGPEDADAGADAADAADGEADTVVGSPRGWGAVARVALVDLGRTSVEASGSLVGAVLASCEDRFERLSSAPEGGYRCTSGGVRPARVEAITGTIATTWEHDGEETTSTRTLNAVTASGATVAFSLRTSTSPYRTSTSIDCY